MAIYFSLIFFFFPLRLKSFGDYKLPLYSYLSVPFIGLFGLSAMSARMLANIFGVLFPIVIFLLAHQFFKDKKIALVAAFAASVSPWLQITARHAHEAILVVFILSITVIFLIRFLASFSFFDFFCFSLMQGVGLFTYHSTKIFSFFFLIYVLYILLKKRKEVQGSRMLFFVVLFLPIIFFLYSEFQSPPTRVQNLIFFRDTGFNLKIYELRNEHNIQIFHNKLTQGFFDLSKQYFTYFSPQFLFISGDANPRFGYPGISPISLVEYIFFLIGLYYLFKRKEKYRFLIILLLFVSPLPASLAWQEYSLTRSFFLVVPILLVASYGFIHLARNVGHRRVFFMVVASVFLIFIAQTWDYYFFHYYKRALVKRSWQCGYKELANYVKENYTNFDEFIITSRHGQPYIELLFYLRYDPTQYQKQARLSPPDEYGFGQVESFDKFNFNFNLDLTKKGISYIGYPEHFEDRKDIDMDKIKKIYADGEEIFWIYENL